MKNHKFILLLFFLFLFSCSNRKLKKGFDIHNNKKITKLSLNQNGKFLQETEVTNLVRKKKAKRKDKFKKPRLKDLKFVKHTLIHEGYWKVFRDTIFVDAVIRYSRKYFKSSDFYKIEIEEKYDKNFSNTKFEIIDNGEEIPEFFYININSGSFFRFQGSKSNHRFYNAPFKFFEIKRYGAIQYFDFYFPKNNKFNHFKITISKAKTDTDPESITKLWAKQFLLKDSFAIPGTYYYNFGCGEMSRPTCIFKAFDFSQSVPLNQ